MTGMTLKISKSQHHVSLFFFRFEFFVEITFSYFDLKYKEKLENGGGPKWT